MIADIARARSGPQDSAPGERHQAGACLLLSQKRGKEVFSKEVHINIDNKSSSSEARLVHGDTPLRPPTYPHTRAAQRPRPALAIYCTLASGVSSGLARLRTPRWPAAAGAGLTHAHGSPPRDHTTGAARPIRRAAHRRPRTHPPTHPHSLVPTDEAVSSIWSSSGWCGLCAQRGFGNAMRRHPWPEPLPVHPRTRTLTPSVVLPVRLPPHPGPSFSPIQSQSPTGHAGPAGAGAGRARACASGLLRNGPGVLAQLRPRAAWVFH